MGSRLNQRNLNRSEKKKYALEAIPNLPMISGLLFKLMSENSTLTHFDWDNANANSLESHCHWRSVQYSVL